MDRHFLSFVYDVPRDSYGKIEMFGRSPLGSSVFGTYKVFTLSFLGVACFLDEPKLPIVGNGNFELFFEIKVIETSS